MLFNLASPIRDIMLCFILVKLVQYAVWNQGLCVNYSDIMTALLLFLPAVGEAKAKASTRDPTIRHLMLDGKNFFLRK